MAKSLKNEKSPMPIENKAIFADALIHQNRSNATIHSIQFLRFIAASMVVIFHSYDTYASLFLASEHRLTSEYYFGFGKCGVHIFFVISGYIMYLTSFARSKQFAVKKFLFRRFIRIYPIYWIFVALYLVAAAALGNPANFSHRQFWEMLALIPGNSSLVIGAAWTLSYELYFYLVFGFVMWLGPWRGTVALTAVLIVSIAVGMIVRPETAVATLATNGLLIEFLMGVWIARLTLTRAFPHNAGRMALALAVGGYALGLIWGYAKLASAIIWGVPSALLVLGAVLTERRGLHLHGLLRRLSWLGDSSYSLYLCHILLITLVMAALRSTGSTPALPFLLVVTTLGCIWFAVIFHALIERPLTGILHRLTVAEPRRETFLIRSNG